jgi:hypothetical protein
MRGDIGSRLNATSLFAYVLVHATVNVQNIYKNCIQSLYLYRSIDPKEAREKSTLNSTLSIFCNSLNMETKQLVYTRSLKRLTD